MVLRLHHRAFSRPEIFSCGGKKGRKDLTDFDYLITVDAYFAVAKLPHQSEESALYKLLTGVV